MEACSVSLVHCLTFEHINPLINPDRRLLRLQRRCAQLGLTATSSAWHFEFCNQDCDNGRCGNLWMPRKPVQHHKFTIVWPPRSTPQTQLAASNNHQYNAYDRNDAQRPAAAVCSRHIATAKVSNQMQQEQEAAASAGYDGQVRTWLGSLPSACVYRQYAWQ